MTHTNSEVLSKQLTPLTSPPTSSPLCSVPPPSTPKPLVYIRQILVRSNDSGGFIRCINHYLESATARVSGFAGFSGEGGYYKARLTIESSMENLIRFATIVSTHPDMTHFKFRGPVNPLGKHLYRYFTIARHHQPFDEEVGIQVELDWFLAWQKK